MTRTVRKAVFPVAGLGTRLLPATKTMPKEMLTIVDRPLIQYAVDEAREAGIQQMIFVTGRGKATLVDYFDRGFELEATMQAAGKSLDALIAIPQPSPRPGLPVGSSKEAPVGHSISLARAGCRSVAMAARGLMPA
jgi:UTP--glucose-1-phosphate uridylyltransferase